MESDEQSENTNLAGEDLEATVGNISKKRNSPNQSDHSEEDTQKTLSDRPIQNQNDNLFYKNVREILDEKGTDETLSSFEDGDAPKQVANKVSNRQLKMVESGRESFDLNHVHKLYENLNGDSAPTKHTSNMASNINSHIQNTQLYHSKIVNSFGSTGV